MGSHLLYAAACGCKTALAGPYVEENREQWLRASGRSTLTPDTERLLQGCSEATNKVLHPWLFVDHPRNAIIMDEWARQEVGQHRLLDDATIKNVLGWAPLGIVTGMARAAKNRIRRALLSS
jgi:hypothetical protein